MHYLFRKRATEPAYITLSTPDKRIRKSADWPELGKKYLAEGMRFHARLEAMHVRCRFDYPIVSVIYYYNNAGQGYKECTLKEEMKPYLDGFADAQLFEEDYKFEWGAVIFKQDKKTPRVEVMLLEGIEPA